MSMSVSRTMSKKSDDANDKMSTEWPMGKRAEVRCDGVRSTSVGRRVGFPWNWEKRQSPILWLCGPAGEPGPVGRRAGGARVLSGVALISRVPSLCIPIPWTVGAVSDPRASYTSVSLCGAAAQRGSWGEGMGGRWRRRDRRGRGRRELWDAMPGDGHETSGDGE